MPPACFLNAPTNRLPSCAAAAYAPNGRTQGVVRRRHQRQRRWSRDDSIKNKKEKLTQTCGMQPQFCAMHSAQGSEETIGFFRLFCPLFQLLGKVGRRRQIKIFCLAFNKSVNNCKLLLQNGKAVSIILNWEKFGNLP